jgi:hypothetical protein
MIRGKFLVATVVQRKAECEKMGDLAWKGTEKR